MKHLSIFLIILSLEACALIQPISKLTQNTHKSLFDLKDTHYWEGYANDSTYRLELTNASDTYDNSRYYTSYDGFYDAHLIINENDTIHLFGYIIGSDYPAEAYCIKNTDTASLGSVRIFKMSRKADSAKMHFYLDTFSFLPKSILLYKKEKALAP